MHGNKIFANALYLAASLFIFQPPVGMAQMNLRGWHEFGQTWLVWEVTAPTPETYRVYRASSQITDASSAEQIGRIFEIEWKGTRLSQFETDSTWTIPNGSGGSYSLANNEGLFVYTPHQATPEYFAVVKDGETVVGSTKRVGPISQTIDTVQSHRQSSGLEGGFNYKIYAHWIDGQDDWNSGRPDYPVMGNEHFNGTAHLFRVWEPQGGVGSSVWPAVIALHFGGGSYAGVKPGSNIVYDLSQSDAIVISPDDYVLIKKTDGPGYQKTSWLGYWEGYNRFSLLDQQPVPDDGIVVDYTMRRIDWELTWLIDNESIDPKRVSLLGGSMGGRGANYQARAHPERYAAWLSLSPGLEPIGDDPLLGNAFQNVSTNLPGSPSVTDVMDFFTPLSESQRDLPFGKIAIGRADAGRASGWNEGKIQTFKTLNDTGLGTHLYWDERAHVFSGNSHWAFSSRLKANALTSYRNDQSFPAFFNDDQDFDNPGRQPDMGNGDPGDGDIWGTWGGYYSWELETIVDSPSRWEATVFLISTSTIENDVPLFDSSKADISIRRPQQFAPSEGSTVDWELVGLSDARIVQSGQATVGEDNVVTIPNLTLDKEKRRLIVSIVSTSVSPPGDASGVPAQFSLSQNYPNPFNLRTRIRFDLSHSEHVQLTVYNVFGQNVEILVDGEFSAASHEINWDASRLSTGLYFYTLSAGSFSDTKTMVLLR